MKTAIKIAPPFLRTPFNYDSNAASDESALDTGTETTVKQSFKDECDINTIVKRFGLGYELPTTLRIPQYGDFTGINDFHTAVNVVAQTNENFEMLSADVRARFNNDPGQFVDFALNPENREELKKMGLLSPEALERDRIALEQSKTTTQGGDSQNSKETPKAPLKESETTTSARRNKAD